MGRPEAVIARKLDDGGLTVVRLVVRQRAPKVGLGSEAGLSLIGLDHPQSIIQDIHGSSLTYYLPDAPCTAGNHPEKNTKFQFT